MYKSWFTPLFTLVFLALSACGQPGYLPIFVPQLPGKSVPFTERGKQFSRPIETVVYIDAAKYNPLNAGDYVMAKTGLPFFDYVIIGDAYIMPDAANNGYYLKFSDELKALLEKRWDFVVPLQKKGIKVLLSITSAVNGPSLGNMNLNETSAFVRIINDTLTIYGLDGVEYNDEGAAPSAYPDPDQYDPDNEDGFDRETWLIMEWLKGSCTISNLCYLLGHYVTRDYSLPIMVRNSNYGARLPDMVPCTTMIADVAGTTASITAILSPRFDVFNDPVNIYGIMGDGDMSGNIEYMGHIELLQDKYTPLAVNLDGGPSQNIGKDGNLYNFFEQFKQNNYFNIVFFSGLKAVSEAAMDPFYNNPAPGNPPKYTQQDIFNNFTTRVMQEEVICTGGDHTREW